tara:strand:+ start:490 stop:675 length:186 start_codon:yes stop_codon:yes gene_type:complete
MSGNLGAVNRSYNKHQGSSETRNKRGQNAQMKFSTINHMDTGPEKKENIDRQSFNTIKNQK